MKKQILLASCLVFAACDSPATPPATVESSGTFRFGESTNLMVNQVMDSDDPSAKLDLMDREAQIDGVIQTASSARQASASASAIANGAADPRTQSILRESVAQGILARWGYRASADDRDIFAAATTVLVECQSPEATLVKAGLDIVGDRWTAERRREAAAVTLTAIDDAGLRRCLLCDSNGPGNVAAEQRAMLGSDASVVAADYAGVQKDFATQTARRDRAVRELEQIAQ